MKALKMDWSVIGKCRSELFGMAILAVFCVHSNEFYWPPSLSTVVKILSQGSIGVDIFLFGDGNVGEYLFKIGTLSFWFTGEGTVWYISFLLIMYMVYPAVYQLRKQSFAKYGFLFL